MTRRLFHILAATALATLLALLASGCSSRKSTAMRGSDGYRKGGGHSEATIKPPRDYSYEVPDAMGLDLVGEARQWLGTPYRYGGQDRDGTDCSGLVMEVYRKVCLVKIPRTTKTQKSYCLEVARNKARAGDLFFFGSSAGRGSDISHVGLYIGGGEMIHASSSRGVMVSPVDTGYWGERFRGVGRVGGASESWASAKGRPNTPVEKAPSPSRTNPDANILPSPDRPLTTEPQLIARADATTATSRPATGEITLGEFAALSASKAASQAGRPTSDAVSKSVESTPAIDLLDQLINEKIDSIFSNRFMD